MAHSTQPVGVTRYAQRVSAPRQTDTYRHGDMRSLARYLAGRAPHIMALGHGTGDDPSQVLHCPFCGSGRILARPDGSIACDFCDSAFVIKIEPTFPGYPQSVDGQPVDIPGVPPEEQGPVGPEAGDPQAMNDAAEAEQQQAVSPMAPPDQAQPPAPPPEQQGPPQQGPPRQAAARRTAAQQPEGELPGHVELQRMVDKARDNELDRHQDDRKYAETYDPLHASDVHQDRKPQFAFSHNSEPKQHSPGDQALRGLFDQAFDGGGGHYTDPSWGVGEHESPVGLTHYRSPIAREPLHLDEHGNAWRRNYRWAKPTDRYPSFEGWSGPHSATDTLDTHPTWSTRHDEHGNRQQLMRSHAEREQMTGVQPGETHQEITQRHNKAMRDSGWDVLSSRQPRTYRTAKGDVLSQRDYLRYLALAHTRDRHSVLNIIRTENRS